MVGVGCEVINGSGFTVTVTVKGVPAHPSALLGVTVYTTSLGVKVAFVQASSKIELAVSPLPVPGEPANAVNPVLVIFVISKVVAAIPVPTGRVNAVIPSEHAEAV